MLESRVSIQIRSRRTPTRTLGPILKPSQGASLKNQPGRLHRCAPEDCRNRLPPGYSTEMVTSRRPTTTVTAAASYTWEHVVSSRQKRLMHEAQEPNLLLGDYPRVIAGRAPVAGSSASRRHLRPKLRVDSRLLLPARSRCLMNMLPVKDRHDGRQNREATELGNQTRTDRGNRGAVSCRRADPEEADP